MDFTELEALAEILSTGFQALLAEVRAQRQTEKALRDKIADAAREYTILSDSLGSTEHSSTRKVLDRLYSDPGNDAQLNGSISLEDLPSSVSPEVGRALQACQALQMKNQVKESVLKEARKCPVIHQAADQEDFEHDFTTPGVKGNLECPFAMAATNGLPATPNSTIDPIAAEFHQDKISVVSPEATAHAGGQCPIRFLDQHSPEEVAKYFENHKHEIPRSHEICVRRYQANENSIRELDAKYGNLVNMIQGLGVKHKQYLPEKDATAGLSEKRDPSSTRAVEKWAEDISQRPEVAELDAGYEADEEERMGHFEKPLREIRVGESPSRPWGISIPPDKETARSATDSDEVIQKSAPTQQDAGKEAPILSCPFGHKKKKQQRPGPVLPTEQEEKGEKSGGWDEANASDPRQQSNKAGTYQIVFNGPIILGYAPEQAMAMLQALKGL